MSASQDAPSGPDFTLGVAADAVPRDGLLTGHCGGEAVILTRRDDGYLAVSAGCTHYGGPLGEGLMVGDTVHCPWHHACFSLRTGEALAGPAIDRLDCWRVEVEGDRVFVRGRAEPQPVSTPSVAAHPRRVVIIGGGAAGFAAAEMLRRRGYQGVLTMLSADDAPPCDRPNLSKDYLAGTAPEDWIPLKPPEFYAEHSIDLRLGFTAARLDLDAREVVGESGERIG
ncbi:MAG TPA: Rieske 2Fe-2S domain-containing protein, partial [Brevundimonas sp.]|nr:Rieske 2Fe-2S domain-containing protein [Brevundimonas sp.]